MKGIVLAGGSGTRLYPMTLPVSKQLLPVYDKPMIYYPLSVLMLGGIRDILVISTPRDLPSFQHLLGDGSRWGVSISYAAQPSPDGLAQAFVIGADFIGNSPCTLVLGDNILYGHGLPAILRSSFSNAVGATVFAHRVSDPQRYGVVTLDRDWRPVSIVEKPRAPQSDWAIIGLYIYPPDVVDIARALRRSERGEYEITDVNTAYLESGRLHVELLGRGFAWFDTGTPDSLLDAANYVATIEKRQAVKIASPEEIAFRSGFIGDADLERLVDERYRNGAYGAYLRRILTESAKAMPCAMAAE